MDLPISPHLVATDRPEAGGAPEIVKACWPTMGGSVALSMIEEFCTVRPHDHGGRILAESTIIISHDASRENLSASCQNLWTV